MRSVSLAMMGFKFDPAKEYFRAWLFTVLRHAIPAYFRKLSRAPVIARETFLLEKIENTVDQVEASDRERDYQIRLLNWGIAKSEGEFCERIWTIFSSASPSRTARLPRSRRNLGRRAMPSTSRSSPAPGKNRDSVNLGESKTPARAFSLTMNGFALVGTCLIKTSVAGAAARTTVRAMECRFENSDPMVSFRTSRPEEVMANIRWIDKDCHYPPGKDCVAIGSTQSFENPKNLFPLSTFGTTRWFRRFSSFFLPKW